MSKTLLKITTSINGPNSVSNGTCDAFVGAWKEKNPDCILVERDLQATPVPLLDMEGIK